MVETDSNSIGKGYDTYHTNSKALLSFLWRRLMPFDMVKLKYCIRGVGFEF